MGRIFGSRREEVAGGLRRLRNEKLHNFYPSRNIIRLIISRRMGWAGRVGRMGGMKNAYSILVGKSEGNSSLGRPRLKIRKY